MTADGTSFNGNHRIGKRVHRHHARTRVGEGICNADCGQRLVLANEDRATSQAGATHGGVPWRG